MAPRVLGEVAHYGRGGAHVGGDTSGVGPRNDGESLSHVASRCCLVTRYVARRHAVYT